MFSYDEFMNKMSNPEAFEYIKKYTVPSHLSLGSFLDEEEEEETTVLPEFILTAEDVEFLMSCGWSAAH